MNKIANKTFWYRGGFKSREFWGQMCWIMMSGVLINFSSLKLVQPDTQYLDVVLLFFIVMGVKYSILCLFRFIDWYHSPLTDMRHCRKNDAVQKRGN
ncbi:hypothetical protein J2125_004458 [Erwinia toletana]|uniref:Inner membrane protein n=1 Tax=Winslowiella toletana TaxID=92490 RepID=A0ABS4PGN0_9GAMM|nr:hypothetical protein [Winslowiella toletana]